MLKCQHCEKPNKENWFYCKECGKRASAPKFTTNSFMRSDIAKRSDIEFNTMDMDKSIDKMRNQKWGLDG
jgi:uncharacterized membrane protein YvbJ|tara:strand:- start:381 stop:590 length:210 start_codon:yes stop_codon:yes gene_type:complete